MASEQSKAGEVSAAPSEGGPSTQEEKLTQCLLGQYRFCVGAVGLGTAYSLRYKKGLIPMIAAGAVGTTADMAYGYFIECAEFRSAASGSDQSKE
mmetsp:Transcript_8694/g.23491  ORF Transcript_8694/g.23491 Transcript_8694/m.23491 type:complete len:95 (-) Transcript_8694:12-296(-)